MSTMYLSAAAERVPFSWKITSISGEVAAGANGLNRRNFSERFVESVLLMNYGLTIYNRT